MKQISEYIYMDDFLENVEIVNRLLPNPYYDYPYLIIDDFLTQFECEGYIDFVKHNDRYEKAAVRVLEDGFVKEDVDNSIRNTYLYELNEPLEKLFLERFKLHTKTIEEFFKAAILSSTKIQVLGYSKGCFYKSHADDSSYLIDENENIVGFKSVASERKLTTIVFLNSADTSQKDGFGGGEVEFSFLQTHDMKRATFYPKKGSLLAFYSNPIFSHEIKPVTSGFRITLVRWHDLIL